MNNSTKLIIISLLILLVLSASGCQSTNDNDDGTDDSTDDGTDDSTDDGTDGVNALQKRLMSVEHFSDPQLADTPVTCDNPDVEIISYKLIDNRKYEDDLNWSIEVVYENTGKSPMWITNRVSVLNGPNGEQFDRNTNKKFNFVKSGERGMFVHEGKTLMWGGNSCPYKGMMIQAHNTVMPDVSPELQHVQILQTINEIPVDVNSMKYKENEKGWKYVVIGLTKHNTNGAIDVIFGMETRYGLTNPRLLEYEVVGGDIGYLMEAEKTRYIEFPLKEYTPDKLLQITVKD